ncbi:cytochrome c3 family protein [Desulfurivibrio alkaliphilus]|uniref:Cytochrome C family protein n=1 Tax=Desulfurivibrio alkaliphilus (strain DSM 19089 / UNIQEM U267 / AHT2) TaxID=589865 RepID=D6Z1P2_DESAT|nr:cytochrome c3 family protein [Desulfurivibrio alkaliphilus]ADH85467.1 cytochrome C family protein [Desulfurivibrio alkaliphilus AHT 2]
MTNRWLRWLLCCWVAAAAATAEAETAIFLAPPEGQVWQTTRTHLSVVVQWPDQAEDRPELRHNQQLQEPHGVYPTELAAAQFAHFRLELHEGLNRLELVPGGPSLEMIYRPRPAGDEAQQYRFHRRQLLPATCRQCHSEQAELWPTAPYREVGRQVCLPCHQEKLTQAWRHGPSINYQCLECHRPTSEEVTVVLPAGPVDQLCFRCHSGKEQLFKQPHVHAPVAVGDCTVCHDPHGDVRRRQLWAGGKGELCVACHGDKTALVHDPERVAGYVHGIIGGGGCTACHDPHAAGQPFLLAVEINELCLGCHTSLRGVEKGHPIGAHPVAGADDPARPGRRLSCTSCHDPHQADFPALLGGRVLGGTVCKPCHR